MYSRFGLLGYATAVLAIMALQQHALVYDKVKNVFLLHLKDDPDLRKTPQDVLMYYRRALADWHFFDAFILYIAYYYVSASVVSVVPTPSDPAERALYRERNSTSMRLAAYLGTGTSNTLWYIMLLAVPRWPVAVWVFAFVEIVLLTVVNVLVRLRTRHTMPPASQLRFVEQELPPIFIFASLAVLVIAVTTYLTGDLGTLLASAAGAVRKA